MKKYAASLLALSVAFVAGSGAAVAGQVEINLDVLNPYAQSPSTEAIDGEPLSAEADESFTVESLRKKYGLDDWTPPSRDGDETDSGVVGDAVAVPAPLVKEETFFVPIPAPPATPVRPERVVESVPESKDIDSIVEEAMEQPEETPADVSAMTISDEEVVDEVGADADVEVVADQPADDSSVSENDAAVEPAMTVDDFMSPPKWDAGDVGTVDAVSGEIVSSGGLGNTDVADELAAIDAAESEMIANKPEGEELILGEPLPADDPRGDVVGSLIFQYDDIRLDQFEQDRMQEEYLQILKRDSSRRIAIYAYAGVEGRGEKKAKRLSLSRALQVRSYLIENGIAGGRIDLFPQGYEDSPAPNDRVDIVLP
jgi:outer membrane protein OmpA-like peptidoglycan-associated protein